MLCGETSGRLFSTRYTVTKYMDTVICYLGNTQELCSILTRDSRLQKSCKKLTVELMNQEEWHTVGVEKKSWGGGGGGDI